ncbi:MAG TPA: hypothetical protein VFA18_16690 [Gemmataceae bacterium]|nr:hypothetical protein [Gemmataceae bacterium]
MALQQEEDFGAGCGLCLLAFTDGFGQREVFQYFRENLMQQLALFLQGFYQSLFQRSLEFGLTWIGSCHVSSVEVPSE